MSRQRPEHVHPESTWTASGAGRSSRTETETGSERAEADAQRVLARLDALIEKAEEVQNDRTRRRSSGRFFRLDAGKQA